jgi:hypothetical protein
LARAIRAAPAAGRGKATAYGAGFSTPIVLARLRGSFAARVFRTAHGALAQLGERLLCKHQVIGSIPISSTTCHIPRDEEKRFRVCERAVLEAFGFRFDIVNGFLKSMP